MKKVILLQLIILMIASCGNILDKDIDTNLSKEQIFSDEHFAQGFLNSSYRELINGFNRLDGAMLACASDEAICSFSGSMVHGFNNGALSPTYNPEKDVWKNMYIGIRKANMFLAELDNLIKKSGLIDKNDSSRVYYKRMKGEAYFLRGMYHFELARRFQTIQLVDTVLTEEMAKLVKQSTFEEAIQFIVNDCDSAAVYLKNFNVKDVDYGRATRLSAFSLKSRSLLYLASPLNNREADRQRWKDAADAAKVIMDVQAQNTNRLSLQAAYHTVFTVPYNQEIIFATSAENTNEIELYNNPISYGGKGYTNPSKELTDSYEMTNGKFIDEEGSGYNPDKPSAGRDDRFQYTISFNGLKFSGTLIETFVGGKDGLNKTSTATKTGYYMRKYIDQNLKLSRDEKRRRPWIIFRYAEILLNYAEAMNEYLDVPDKSVYDAVNLLRKRGKLKQLDINQNLTKEEMRKRIHNERRVEFAFEEHRFWDVRRWEEGEVYFNKPIHGIKITRLENGTFTYETIEVENRIFYPRMNYFPIPQSELLKNKNMVQNPSWR